MNSKIALMAVANLLLVLCLQLAAQEPPPGAAAPAAEPPVAEPSPSQAKAEAILKRFFAAADEAARRRAADELAMLEYKDWGHLRESLHRLAPYPDLKPGEHRLRAPAQEAVPAIDYLLRVPAGYDAHRRDGWPLVIGLHGTGGNAAQQMRTLDNLLGKQIDDYLLVCPEAPEPGIFTARRVLMEYPLNVLADVRHQVNVNSDRVILTGFSKGGYTTWAAVMFAPGQWGGAAPMGSFPLTEAGTAGVELYLPNLASLDIQSHWGENDIIEGQKQGINTFNRDFTRAMRGQRASRYEGIEYAGQDHGLKVDVERLRPFFDKARREPFPERGKLIFHALHQGRAWYATAVKSAKADFDFTKPRTIMVERIEDAPAAKRKLLSDEAMELTVSIDRRTNQLRVVGRHITEVEIVVPLEKMDWSRPMRIFFGPRQVLGGAQQVDWYELLETARRSYDFEALVGKRVKATATGR